ncbi:MAG: glycine--tRNA ligase subunit beta [Eggerthellaceae bacterium]|nr:glycine--tRNA ligase subunit beta [Eggerthellaceae bacterium]
MTLYTLAFEIGTEELPAFDLHAATEKLGALMADALDAARVPHGNIEVYTTPRRLAVLASEVPDATEASVQEFRGPAAAIAFDEAGEPTQAALGFARGKGVDASALERRDEDGTEYVYAVVETPSVQVADLLPALLRGLIESISWPKAQRWGSHTEVFSRPVRWLCAMLGPVVLPVEFAGLVATNQTYGHRFLAPGPHALDSAEQLISVLRGAFVIPSEAEREQTIREQVAALEEQTGLVAELPAKTLQEVVNLCEYPTLMVGTFDELFLDVPKEITVDAMLMHQRYFPLFNADGSLTNKFLITSNGNPDCAEGIIDGNERVVAARLYDAKFFYDEDLKVPFESFVDKLDSVVFQEQLGTTRAKTERIEALVQHLATDAGLSASDAADAVRAAHLCKADLVSGAVVEFTSVQGVMGSYYAAAAGENAQVAQAIKEHYQPKFAGDAIPSTQVGQVVAMADKLDTICGLFAIGQGPTASSDPFALRRSAIGIVAMLEAGLPVSLAAAIDASLAQYAAQGLSFDAEAVRGEIIDFFVTRTKVILRDEGTTADAVDAVLSVGVVEPAVIAARTRALEAARANDAETMEDLATAFARANNLCNPDLGADFDEALLSEHEHALSSAVVEAESRVAQALTQDDYPAALTALAALRKPIDEFFENVMVMDDDPSIRDNRLRLLNRFVGVFADVADFSLLAKSSTH